MAKKRKQLHAESNTKSSKSRSSDAPLRSRRDVALEPPPKPYAATPRLPTPPVLENDLPTRLRSLSLRNRPSPSIAVEQQQRSNLQQTKKQDQKFWTYLPPTTPLQPSAFDSFEAPPTTHTRLRNLAHRDGPPPPAYRTKHKPPKKQNLEVDYEQGRKEAAPPRNQLPPGTICISTILSVEDLERNKALAMPVALRRPSTSHRGRRFSEKENTRPDSVLTNGLPNRLSAHKKSNAAAHAHNQALINGALPSSTHTHPSQTHAPPPAPSRTEEIDREKALERNIDNVVFGDRMFKAWYPSWYPKEIIGEKALSDAKAVGIVVQTLYVCKKCFGYGKEVHEWVKHCERCQREVPGRRVYMHGAGEGKAEEDCVWSVWEVDGEVDTLFCQNLSLFAKLFLDNKSVFFDVSGFNYFLLVHNPTSQVVGFFSKEKMSWDNNNLACILIFPPWQRKNLGLILMGVSYEISRREEILGGPEKPISDLGKKGYKRFWGREIARWLLEAKETDRKKGKGMVTVGDVSRGTWIHGEDCLAVLREMGVVEKAGKGRGEVERVVLDKVKVREWVDRMGLSLERVVDKEGFVEGYGYKEVVEEEEEAGD